MTSTRKSTSFHAFMLATVTLVAAAGGYMQLNKSRPVTVHSSGVIQSQVVAQHQSVATSTREESSVMSSVAVAQQQPSQAEAQPVVRETTAQKRARYAPHIAAASLASKVDEDLIEAIITAESAFNPAALSRTGALGLMQLMPATALRFGVTDRLDPAQNILGGARYLQFLLNKFNNNLQLAVAAYNAGEGNVKKHGNRIPPFKETVKYVPKVLAYYKKYSAES